MNHPSNDPSLSMTSEALPRPRSRRRWLTLVLALVIFLSGIVVGSAVTVVITVRRIQETIRNPSLVPVRATDRLRRSLDLDQAQTESVRQSLSDLHARLLAIRSSVYPDVQSEIEQARQEISGVLDQRQQAKWDRIFESIRRRWMMPPPAELRGK